jgi:ACS family tartrate transporter-like MFS transporter
MSALASGIAWVNSVGILGGSASPPIVGWFKDVTGGFSGGLYALAVFGPFAAFVAAVGVRETPIAAMPRALEAASGD